MIDWKNLFATWTEFIFFRSPEIILKTWLRDDSETGKPKKNCYFFRKYHKKNSYWIFMLVHGQTENMKISIIICKWLFFALWWWWWSIIMWMMIRSGIDFLLMMIINSTFYHSYNKNKWTIWTRYELVWAGTISRTWLHVLYCHR